ncbi:MAG: type II toxin-antitoxin system RelE/ParE family toxin [Cardiobacteriaceae bacterium]|nr:type II toxin-antitoxin system RelE/ParE family toxin [Cardiobacteriaceae bacterium]
MYQLKWQSKAQKSLLEIQDYLLQEKVMPWVLDKVVDSIEHTAEKHIAFMPYMFPALGSDEHLRVCYLPYPYIIYYRVDDASRTVTVLDIVHGARQSRRH